ncbi:MAG: UbiA-like polyprenyltransferase [Planctomycetota bacterium]
MSRAFPSKFWAAMRTWGEMVKFSHSVFALPFALVAAFLAGRSLPGGLPTLWHVVLIVWCMVSARSFAMTFNRIADAALDVRNPRTAMRPIPAGLISIARAWMFTVTFAMLFICGCAGFRVLFANHWPLLLSIPTLLAMAAYSYCKRFTALSHFVLGAVIAFAPTASWMAIHPESLGWSTIILSGAVFTWIAGFDLIYACQDVGVDRTGGLFSIPARFGIAFALSLSRVCHLVSLTCLIMLGRLESFGWLYWIGVATTGSLLAVEQSIVRPQNLSRVNLAFFTLNGVVSLVFAGAAIGDILMRR